LKENQIAKVDNRVLEAFFKKSNITAFKTLLYIGRSGLDKVVDLDKLDDDTLYTVPIRIRSLSEYYDLDSRTIRDSLYALNQTSINYRRIEHGKDVETFMNILPKAKINYSDETFDCYVFGEVLKLVYALTDSGFSKVNVKNFIRIKGKHTARMLLLIERIGQYEKRNEHNIDIMPKRQHYDLKELNKMFGTKYKSYQEFIRAVLVPAKEELDTHSSLSFEYKAIKERVGKTAKSRGRTPITSITIDVIKN
jgi:plasmid replication initiation protein